MEIKWKTIRNIFLCVLGCIAFYWLLHETERVRSVFNVVKRLLTPFVIGAALAFIFNVPMRFIERHMGFVKNPEFRRIMALLCTVICILLVVALVVTLLLPQIEATIDSIIEQWPEFWSKVTAFIAGVLERNPEIQEWITENIKPENLNIGNTIESVLETASNSLSSILNSTISAIGIVATGIFNAVISLVFALYALIRKEILARQCRRLIYSFLPEHVCDEIVRILRMANSTFSNFISGQCLEAVILGVMFAITMLIFGMPYIPLVSVLIAVTALVPLVGAFVGCILGAFFILVESPIQAVIFVAIFLVLQQIEGNLIYPRVVGTSIGLPGMWVLLAVTVGGELMGVGGMLLMVPMASVLYALMREITRKRLDARGIATEKLNDQPPELRSNFKEQRSITKAKRSKRRLERKSQKSNKK